MEDDVYLVTTATIFYYGEINVMVILIIESEQDHKNKSTLIIGVHICDGSTICHLYFN